MFSHLLNLSDCKGVVIHRLRITTDIKVRLGWNKITDRFCVALVQSTFSHCSLLFLRSFVLKLCLSTFRCWEDFLITFIRFHYCVLIKILLFLHPVTSL